MNSEEFEIESFEDLIDVFENTGDSGKYYLGDYSNIQIANYIRKMQQENQQLKNLKYKFFDNCGNEESFTLEDYLDISNKLYDYEWENKQLKEDKMKVIEYINNDENYEEGYCDGKLMIYKERLVYELLEILGDKENE